ncbi:hypothetical protein [Alteromonas macleodii]|jgi:hypothetical protein|uniref:hypothetical protein n=1 Tax=Alteromonas macleodii TaxID=28108 RepID=UPI00090CB085|nr:hypothetical protein [Alteromonas macleodii]APD87323.1 hypothetical protein BM527_15175 [Alteromonas sp. Mex14]CAI2391230.1 hypothetical protein ALT831_03218 [Alteromonas macleodii]CAI3965577.1 hypothetical protein ALTBGP9_03135 [Alteromonas macleodii]CAI3965957.1 hypothetical protein ALTBGP6_03219 [Alteromonas macleodii]CAI3965962.1 hypothetical protein ALTBGP14_03218 [Alteromonas macleodii]|tara:strand:- start:6899 stop:7267 length:369 start_codon:yes stop_codon:yes gene_type:complete
MASSYPRIGIFWVYQHKLISKSILLSQASYSSVGIADSNFSHIDVWESEKVYLPECPTLFDSEYQALPRGRILFDKKNNTFSMFADRKIVRSKHYRQMIINAFSLQAQKCIWRTDSHYVVFS